MGLELTKLHERHLRDSVKRVREQLAAETEGARLKGEVTLVLAPFAAPDTEADQALRASGFDARRDGRVQLDLISVAKRLNERVEMSEPEFRQLMRHVFDGVPAYHLNQIVRLVRQD